MNRAALEAKRRQPTFFKPLCLALNGLFHPKTGFEMGLNWLYLGLFGFVFYCLNRHFISVKLGDCCLFKLALFRNFHFSARNAHPASGLEFLWSPACGIGAWSFFILSSFVIRISSFISPILP
ncbi:MAG TPA: hypothetical protein VK815_16495 [Candidatus Acidoferrales bacterium]|nr:hypothetical protein [Candidatus Acidoferrales bacterium]